MISGWGRTEDLDSCLGVLQDGHLSKRLHFEVRLCQVFSLGQVDVDNFGIDALLNEREAHAGRAGRPGGSVELENHCV